ncbi:Hypothetical protein BN2458_PEG1588 [Helicobacter typhlonius]|uniref:Uncharacterized protein n=1 Tax=Helicobacter typhlonius TaxID=76936 RepID=A0A0S4PXM1_9HELI|nr:Hypothetical protein BN2458_PEG1588 [Helicobacter typhlonius]
MYSIKIRKNYTNVTFYKYFKLHIVFSFFADSYAMWIWTYKADRK